MNKNNAENINLIIAAIDINSRKQILLNGKPSSQYSEDSYSSQPSGKMLFDELNQIIYRKFYIQPCKPESNKLPTPDELKKNIEALSNVNLSKEQFDEGWLIENTDDPGALIARKGNRFIRLKPGEYLNVKKAGKQNEQREVRIYTPREYCSRHDIFYFAYGSAVQESDESGLIRFYFNTSFEGNKKWVHLFTDFLNEFAVPFVFKCLVHPFYYGRSDTAVLYCNQQYAGFVSDYISSACVEMKKFMRNSLPLFVYPFKKGIGFAEQPETGNESFGSHWSKLIAAGIMKAHEENLGKEKWPDEVMKHIRMNHGYTDVNKFYRNPKSKYPYPFIRNEK
jgi:HopA1 effector protein family